MKITGTENGYVALISVILMTVTLLTIAVVVSSASITGRFNQLGYESKRVSVGLAEACANTALLEIAKDLNYGQGLPPEGQCVSVGDACGAADAKKFCLICSATAGPNTDIVTRAVYNNAVTNLKVSANFANSDYAITSWEEYAPYAGSCQFP